MIRNYSIIRESATAIADAAENTIRDYQDDRVEQEPAFTDRMLGRIAQQMDGFVVKGVTWHAKTLTDRGRNAQENRYGADFMGVLELDLPDYKINKGFLAQAKLLEPDGAISSRDFNRMVSQCKDMLKLTPDAYVFLYSSQEINVVPANSIVSLTSRCNPHELYHRRIRSFFEQHFECFIGDRRLHKAHINTVAQLTEVV